MPLQAQKRFGRDGLIPGRDHGLGRAQLAASDERGHQLRRRGDRVARLCLVRGKHLAVARIDQNPGLGCELRRRVCGRGRRRAGREQRQGEEPERR